MDANKKSRKSGGGAQKKSVQVAPVAVSRDVKPRRIPSMKSNGVWTSVSHRECFATVVSSSTAFAVASYSLNPGVPSVFPWLSQVAARYETYKFRRLSFSIRTQSATTAVGSVGMAFDFDANDPAPTSLLMGLSYRDRSLGACWAEQRLDLDLRQGDKSPSKFTRVGLPTEPYDLKTYDLGVLHVFTEGVSAATVGILEADYTVDLFTPQIQDPIGGSFHVSTGMDATHLFGTAIEPNAGALLPGAVTSTSVFTFDQAFEGLVTVRVSGTTITDSLDLGISATGLSTGISAESNVNSAGTKTTKVFKVRAQHGTTLTPTVTAAAVSAGSYSFARGAYSSYD